MGGGVVERQGGVIGAGHGSAAIKAGGFGTAGELLLRRTFLILPQPHVGPSGSGRDWHETPRR